MVHATRTSSTSDPDSHREATPGYGKLSETCLNPISALPRPLLDGGWRAVPIKPPAISFDRRDTRDNSRTPLRESGHEFTQLRGQRSFRPCRPDAFAARCAHGFTRGDSQGPSAHQMKERRSARFGGTHTTGAGRAYALLPKPGRHTRRLQLHGLLPFPVRPFGARMVAKPGAIYRET